MNPNKKIVSAALLAALLGGTTVALIPSSAQAASCSGPVTVAHRGGTEKYVENTRKAWDYAMANGTQYIETDVQFTKDDVPVIMHDSTVDRTTNGTGAIKDLTLAQLRTFRTSDGQYVPTLYEFLTDVKHYGAKAFPELKETPRNQTEWHAWKQRFDWLGMRSQVTIYSFDFAAVHTAQAMGFNTAIIDDVGDRPASFVTDQGTHTWLKAKDSITAARNQKWLAGGVNTYAWTPDTPTYWSYLRNDRVAGVITDKPVAYKNWLNSQCK